VEALASFGVEIRTNKGGLPAEVVGLGHIAGGEVTVDCKKSSQFATAIMLIAPLFDDSVRLLLTGLTGSSGYLEVSRQVMVSFGAQVESIEGGFEIGPTGYRGASFTVEPDASAAVYPLVAAAITAGRAEIDGLHFDSSQPDLRLADALEEMGCQVTAGEEGMVLTGPERLNPIDTNMAEAPDAALALAVACLFANGESRIRGLASLRHKESDRLRSLVETFTELGARARVEDDTLIVTPGRLRGAVIDSHGDHRVAMSLALVGLRVPGVAIARPEVVAKTWREYWSVLERMGMGG
jgi:3-phosphoshikimate 1-carboxyvinyltransferase